MMGGQVEREDDGGLDGLHAAEDAADQGLDLVGHRRAVGEGLHAQDHEGGVGLVAAIQQREADDGEDVLDLRDLLDHGLHALDHAAGAGDACAVRQLYRDEEGALVLLGQEAGRRAQAEAVDAGAEGHDENDGEDGDAQQAGDDAGVAVAAHGRCRA